MARSAPPAKYPNNNKRRARSCHGRGDIKKRGVRCLGSARVLAASCVWKCIYARINTCFDELYTWCDMLDVCVRIKNQIIMRWWHNFLMREWSFKNMKRLIKFVAFAKVLWFDDENYLCIEGHLSISFYSTANGQCDYRSWLPRLITLVEWKICFLLKRETKYIKQSCEHAELLLYLTMYY